MSHRTPSGASHTLNTHKARSRFALGRYVGALRALVVPILSIITALIIGAFLIILTDAHVVQSFTRIPLRVVDQVADSQKEITREQALRHHPDEVQVGDLVQMDGLTLRVTAQVENERSQISLEEARGLYPSLRPGVTVHVTFFQRPAVGLAAAWNAVHTAYSALFEGSIGSPRRMVDALGAWITKGDTGLLVGAFYPLSESLVAAAPYVLVGLAVALGFRAGLFNIGAEGQYFIGGLTSVFVGYSITGVPFALHLPLMLMAGIIGGGLWGAIPGYLKATTGAHEVINTIMMNYIAFSLSDWLLSGPMQRPGFRPISPQIQPSATLPQFFPNPIRLHAGVVLAVLAAVFAYWLLFKTTIGFELQTVGANPRAARYAGISITKNYVLAMFLSGGLAGLAAANDISGLIRYMPAAFSAGYGFDSIALALLGRSHPVGVVLAALLFGILRAGATRMQSVAQIPIDIISILQALIIIFIAAPEIIRSIYRVRSREEDEGLVRVSSLGKAER